MTPLIRGPQSHQIHRQKGGEWFPGAGLGHGELVSNGDRFSWENGSSVDGWR